MNDAFVPVWVNVREERFPFFPARSKVLTGAQLRADDTLDVLGLGFFSRSVVLSAELELLNEQGGTVAASFETLGRRGYFAYAQTNADDYLEMLNAALAKHRPHRLACRGSCH